MLQLWLFRMLAVLVPRTPRRVGLWLFGLLAPVVARLAPTRHAVRDNMRHVLGAAATASDVDRCVVSVFRHQLWNYWDLFWAPTISVEEVRDVVDVLGRPEVERAFRGPSGVVLVTPHYGNLEVVARVIGALGFRGVLAVEKLEPEALFALVCDLRRQDGMAMIPAAEAVRPMLRALRSGDAAFLAVDRDVTGSAEPVTCFGETARLPNGYARLAYRAGANVVVALSARLPDHRFAVRCVPVPLGSRSGSEAGDVAALQRRVLDVVEAHVAERPDQWVLFQRVWLPAPVTPESSTGGRAHGRHTSVYGG